MEFRSTGKVLLLYKIYRQHIVLQSAEGFEAFLVVIFNFSWSQSLL